MFTFDRKPRPSAAGSPAPKHALQRSAQAPPVNPLWFRLVTSTNTEATSSHEMTAERRRYFEPRIAAVVPPPIQCKATVSSPSDQFEREADELADKVMRMAEPDTIGSAPVSIQRKCASCEEEEKKTIQTKRAPSAQTGAYSNAEAAVRAAARGGERLPQSVRDHFEPRFGFDFSQVRVHADGEAAQAAQAVQARAYTVGTSIVFGRGQYAPEAPDGKRLLAHELTHVIQQTSTAPFRGITRTSDQKVQRSLQTYVTAMNKKPEPDWGLAAEHLNGEAVDVIRQILDRLSPAYRARLHKAAISWPGVDSNIAKLTKADYEKVFPAEAAAAKKGPEESAAATPPAAPPAAVEPTQPAESAAPLSCEAPLLSQRRKEGVVYGTTLSEAADTAALLEGAHPDDFDLVPTYRRPFLKRIGERSWAVSPPAVTLADETEASCFVAGVNEGIRAFQESEIFWGKVADALTLLSLYLTARSFGRILVSSGAGPGRPPPRLTLIRGGGSGAPAPVIETPPAGVQRPVVGGGGRGATAVAAAPVQAPEVTPVAPPRPKPVLVHSQPQAQPAAPPAPTTPLSPAVGAAAAAAAAAAAQQQQPNQAACTPTPVCPHLGGDKRHNLCADGAPPNRFPGCDVLVNGKRFDALQVGANVLWEIKTDNYSTYSEFLKNQVIRTQIPELQRERALATACGFGFVVGVVDAQHQAALLRADPTLAIVLTQC